MKQENTESLFDGIKKEMLEKKYPSENNVPLYKVLNEKRTQGEWAMSSRVFLHIEAGEQWCCQMSDIKMENNYGILTEEYDAESLRVAGITVANAQYTALAVNNLHLLAEALKGAIDYTFADHDIEWQNEYLKRNPNHWIVKAKEALKAIS